MGRTCSTNGANRDAYKVFVVKLQVKRPLGRHRLERSCQSLSYSSISQPEGLSPCSQEPSTGPHPEPDQSSPYHPILSL
jgi:hypothetical protein